MITLTTWQLILAVVVIFLFGWGTGRTMGESRAWEKMDKQETQEVRAPSSLFHNMERTFGNVCYRTEGSTILAMSSGNGLEHYLMKTPNGRYFLQEHLNFPRISSIQPYSREQAIEEYNSMRDHRINFEEVFGEGLIEA